MSATVCECGETYDNEDWWNCPHCDAPSPDLQRARKAKVYQRKKRRPDDGSLRSLLP